MSPDRDITSDPPGDEICDLCGGPGEIETTDHVGFRRTVPCPTCMWQEREADVGRLVATLRCIAKGEGAFSRDPLTHAQNTIGSMILLAREAIDRFGPETTP